MRSTISKYSVTDSGVPGCGGSTVDWLAARKHAERSYPDESCGMVIGGSYLPCDNLAEDPRNGFEIDERMFGAAGDNLDFIVHSHGEGPPYPSEGDMLSQIETAVPWAIIPVYRRGKETWAAKPVFFGDELPIPPLLGRPFRHGITDCYSLIRDFYALEMKIYIPDIPRSWAWWEDEENDQNLYVDFFQEAGFRELRGGEDPQYGDVLFASVKSDKTNHAGVILNNGLMIHHPIDSNVKDGYGPQSLSRHDSASRWLNSVMCKGVVRYGN